MTSYENLESIASEGLVPKKGSRTRSIGDNRCAVFLSRDISNTILMYDSLLYHFNSFFGKRGVSAINRYQRIIKQYQEQAKCAPLKEEDKKELEAMIEAVDWIRQIMAYKDFNDYLGDGVYLMISDVENINMDNPKDCYTEEKITAENIKVVVLKNRRTGEIVDSRECVLSYFMNIVSCEELLEGIHNVITIKTIKDLYLHRWKEVLYYNRAAFQLEEIPIRRYLETKEKNKEKQISRFQDYLTIDCSKES